MFAKPSPELGSTREEKTLAGQKEESPRENSWPKSVEDDWLDQNAWSSTLTS